MYNIVYKIYDSYKKQNNLPLKKNTQNTHAAHTMKKNTHASANLSVLRDMVAIS